MFGICDVQLFRFANIQKCIFYINNQEKTNTSVCKYTKVLLMYILYKVNSIYSS